MNWSEVFGNDRPVEIEVGFGKGAFLVATAQAHPEMVFEEYYLAGYSVTPEADKPATRALIVKGTSPRLSAGEQAKTGSRRHAPRSGRNRGGR